MKISRLIRFITYCYYIVFALGIIAVLAFSLRTTIVFRQYTENDLFDYVRENLPLLLGCLAVILAVTWWLLHHKYLNRNTAGKIEAAALIFAAATGTFLILSIRGLATNDALMLDRVINEFMEGDYSAMQPGGYLSVYPFQIGYVMAGQLLYRLAGPSNYAVYQWINLASILLTMYFLYKITGIVFGDEETAALSAVLSFGALFYYTYATYVYNDIWSVCLQTGAVFFCICYLHGKDGKWRIISAAAAVIMIAAGYLLKSNCLIALIAMAATLLFRAVKELEEGQRRIALERLAVIILMCCVSFGSSRLVNRHYAALAGMESMPKGVPTMSYLAMGMQEGEEGKAGWYNGFNARSLSENNYDWDTANEISKEAVRERWADFMSSRRRMVKFYYDKFISQWGDGTCVSLREQELTARHVENQPEIAEWIVYGTGYRAAGWIMNVWHSLIYLGTAVYCVFAFRKRKPSDEEAMLVMFIFGGMMFHELWEASGRYIIRYYLTMLPLAAYGFNRLLNRKPQDENNLTR